MKHISRYMAVMATLFGLLVMPSLAQDDSTPVTFTLDRLLDGAVVEDAFEGSISAKLYFFFGNEGDLVTISMTQEEDSSLDPYVVLLGPAGEVIASDDDSGELGLSSLISEAELPQDGTYFVLASSFGYIRAGAVTEEDLIEEPLYYTLTLDGTSFDNENLQERFTFQGGRLEFGAELQPALTLEEPIYYYTFFAEEGDIIDITMDSEDFDPLLYLFSTAGGLRLASNDDDNSLNSAIRDFEIPETGEYMVFATHAYYYYLDEISTFEGGDFTISLTQQ